MIALSTTKPADFPGLIPIIDATGLFPSDLLPQMFAEEPALDADPAIWVTAAGPRGFAYARHETFTERTWNLLAIAVAPDAQGQGIGAALLAEVEIRVRNAGGHVLLIDTADVAEFEPARAFYRSRGYVEEARIRDFWAPSVAKITFWKRL